MKQFIVSINLAFLISLIWSLLKYQLQFMSKSEKAGVLRGNTRELNMRNIHMAVTQIISSVFKASITDIFSV